MSVLFYILGQQNNPFLSDGQQPAYAATGARLQGQGDQQYYGRGYSQAQSGYSSAGLGMFKMKPTNDQSTSIYGTIFRITITERK